jgi:hypothetical protein
MGAVALVDPDPQAMETAKHSAIGTLKDSEENQGRPDGIDDLEAANRTASTADAV